jgi:hypothetical protein
MKCDMPKELSQKGAMKEVLAALSKQMFDRMNAGKSQESMSGKEVKEALSEAGEGETMDPEAMALHEGTEGTEEAMMEGEKKPKGKVLELSTVKLGLLAPGRGVKKPMPPMPEKKMKAKGRV